MCHGRVRGRPESTPRRPGDPRRARRVEAPPSALNFGQLLAGTSIDHAGIVQAKRAEVPRRTEHPLGLLRVTRLSARQQPVGGEDRRLSGRTNSSRCRFPWCRWRRKGRIGRQVLRCGDEQLRRDVERSRREQRAFDQRQSAHRSTSCCDDRNAPGMRQSPTPTAASRASQRRARPGLTARRLRRTTP